MKKMAKDELLSRLSDVSEFYYQQMYDESAEKTDNLQAMGIAQRFIERQYPEKQQRRRKGDHA